MGRHDRPPVAPAKGAGPGVVTTAAPAINVGEVGVAAAKVVAWPSRDARAPASSFPSPTHPLAPSPSARGTAATAGRASSRETRHALEGRVEAEPVRLEAAGGLGPMEHAVAGSGREGA